MGWKDKAVTVAKSAALLPLYDFFGGLSEFYAVIFAISGIVLAFRGKLDSNFAAMIVAIQGLLVAHDALDDYHTRKRRDGDKDLEK
jgi:hypothetical protein